MPAVYSIMRTSASNGADRGLYVYKLIDFGISVLAQDSQQAAETLLQTGTQGLQLCKGTIHWMSPEQVSPEIAVDTRTDLWSLAAVLYRVLSGVAPFAPYEQDAFTIAYEIRNAVVRPMARSVPDGLSQIVQRGLQRPATSVADSSGDANSARGHSSRGSNTSATTWTSDARGGTLLQSQDQARLYSGRPCSMGQS
eukprot:COSAG01_NODE_18546_length_1069_cov_1.110309_2_plen_196_part_00